VGLAKLIELLLDSLDALLAPEDRAMTLEQHARGARTCEDQWAS